jgi:hypothetical protein
MNPTLRNFCPIALVSAFLLLSPGLAGPASALEAVVSLSQARPDVWSTGVGGTLASTWFRVVSLEGEVFRQPGELADSSMTSFTGSALLAPPVGPLVPYGGFGVGVFRQSQGARRDNGTLKAFVLGVKFRLGLLVLRAEYRGVDLSGDPLLEMDKRLSAGIGVSF